MEMQWYNLLQAQALSSFHVSIASVLFDQCVITFVTLLWIPSKLLRRCPRLNIIICPWSDQSCREIILHYTSPCIVDTSASYTLLLPYYTTNSHLIICSVSYLCFISTSLGFSLLPYVFLHGKQSFVCEGRVGVEVNRRIQIIIQKKQQKLIYYSRSCSTGWIY